MKRKKKRFDEVPGLELLRAELKRERYKNRYKKILRSTIYSLIVVAAVAVLVATLWLPVLQIYGTSMAPALDEGQIVIAVKGTKLETGDLISFYWGNRLLIKRCVARPGQWVDIDAEGNVYVDGELLDEPYVTEKAMGECDIELPYQVPENTWFLMGDHRTTSIDSRSSTVGCISKEQILGKVVYRIWPLDNFGVLQ